MSDAASTIQNALGELLEEHDLAPAAAGAFAAELIRDYPLVRRQGVCAATVRLCELGMPPAEAREAALEMLAFELLGRLPYEQVLEAVGAQCAERDPLGVCLRAARLRREVTRQAQPDERGAIGTGTRIVRLALSWLGSSR